MSAVHVPGITAPPSTACRSVDVASDPPEGVCCREHGIPINPQLYI